MSKIRFVTGVLLLLLTQGCTQPQMKFDAQNKQKIQAVIWDGVHYHTGEYLQEASKNQVKKISLDKAIFGLDTFKIKRVTKYLNHTIDSFGKSASVVEVYHGLDMGVFTLLSHKVDDIMVAYIDDRLAHVYVSLKKEKKKKKLSDEAIKQAVIKKFGVYSQALKDVYVNTFMKDEPLTDIKNALNRKFGQAFYYASAEINSDSNEIWTWGMHNNFYYKVVVNQDGKYAYLSIISKAFMKILGEDVIDVKKWQKEQNAIIESMVKVHSKDK